MPKIQQLMTKAGRMYTDCSNRFVFSVTTILNQTLPKGFGLDDWNKRYGYLTDLMLPAYASRGRVVHNLAELLKQGKNMFINADVVKEYIEHTMTSTHISMLGGQSKIYDSVCCYLESYCQWFEDYNPTFLGSEVMLFHPELDYAGTTDDPIIIGDTLIMSDIKTSSAIQESHWCQAYAYLNLWNKMFPDYQMEQIAILRLKDNFPKGIPSYEFKVKKDFRKIKEQWELALEMFRLKNRNAKGEYVVKEKYEPRRDFQLPKARVINIAEGETL